MRSQNGGARVDTQANGEVSLFAEETQNRNPLRIRQTDSVGRASSNASDLLSNGVKYDLRDSRGYDDIQQLMDLECVVNEIFQLISRSPTQEILTDSARNTIRMLTKPWRLSSFPKLNKNDSPILLDYFQKEDNRVFRLDCLLRKMHLFVDSFFFDRHMLASWEHWDASRADALKKVAASRLTEVFEDKCDLSDFISSLVQFGTLWAGLKLNRDSLFLSDVDDEGLFLRFAEKRFAEMKAWECLYESVMNAPLPEVSRLPSTITQRDADEVSLLASKISSFCKRRQATLRVSNYDTFRRVLVYDVTQGLIAMMGSVAVVLAIVIGVFSVLAILSSGPTTALMIINIVAAVLVAAQAIFMIFSYSRSAKLLQVEHRWMESSLHSLSFEKRWLQLSSRVNVDSPNRRDVPTNSINWRKYLDSVPARLQEGMEQIMLMEATGRRGVSARRILCDVACEQSLNFVVWSSMPIGTSDDDTAKGAGLDDAPLFTSQRPITEGATTVRPFVDDDASENSYMHDLEQMEAEGRTLPKPILPEPLPTQMPELFKIPLAHGEHAFIPTKTLQRDIILIGVRDVVFLWNAAAEDATGFSTAEVTGRKISMIMDAQSVSNLSSLMKQKKMYEYRLFSLSARKGGVVTIRARLATCNVASAVEGICKDNRNIILIGTVVEQTDWYPFTYVYRLYLSVLRQQLATLLESVPNHIKEMFEVMDCAQLRARASQCHGWVSMTSGEIRDAAKRASSGLALVIVDSSVDETFFCDKQELITATQTLIRIACGASDKLKMATGSTPIVVSLTQRNYSDSICLQIRVELRLEFSMSSEGYSVDGKRLPTAPFRVDRKTTRCLGTSEGLILITPDEEADTNTYGQYVCLYVPIARYKLNSLALSTEVDGVQGDGASFECHVFVRDTMVQMYLQRELQSRNHTIKMCATITEAVEAVRSNGPDALFFDSNGADFDGVLAQLKRARDTSVGGTSLIWVKPDAGTVFQEDGVWILGNDFIRMWPKIRDHLSKNKSHRELFHFGRGDTANFERSNKPPLGQGAAGAVYEYEDPVTNAKVAVKEIPANGFSDIDVLTREINIMKQFNHRNIVRYIKAQLKKNTLLIFMEKCDSSLDREISEKRKGGYLLEGSDLYASPQLIAAGPVGLPISFETLRERIEQILSGLLFLHNQGIVHRDIKPANILIKANQMKISDFGSASAYRGGGDTTVGGLKGTLQYMAPEIHNGGSKERRDGCDIWSFGLTVLEMVQATPSELSQCRSLPDVAALYAKPSDGGISIGADGVPNFTFPPLYSCFRHILVDPSKAKEIERDRKRMERVDPTSELYTSVMSFEKDIANGSEELMDLIKRCLRYNVFERENALRLLAHPFFKVEPVILPCAVESPESPQQASFANKVDPLYVSPTAANDACDPLYACVDRRKSADSDSGFSSASGNSW